jgi:hypothetical protein
MIKEGNTKDWKPEDIKLGLLVYGRPGSGKTFFGASCPKPYFLFHEKWEDGLLYYKLRGADVPYASFETLFDLMTLIEQIKRGQKAKDRETIVLDGWDRLTEPIIEQTLMETSKQRMDRNTWGIAVDHLREAMKMFLDIRKTHHVVILGGDTIEKNENTEVIYGLPETIGKFRMAIGGLFDFYFYAVQTSTFKDGKPVNDFHLHTVDYLDFGAKDRSGFLDSKEPNSFPHIFGKIVDKVKAVREALEKGELPPDLPEAVVQLFPSEMQGQIREGVDEARKSVVLEKATK